MTCVVGYCRGGQVWLGADTGAYDSDGGGEVLMTNTAKVWRWEDFVFGTAGSYRAIQILHRWLPDPELLMQFQAATSVENFMVLRLVPAIKELFETHNHGTKTNDESEHGSTLLIGAKGKLFALYADYAVLQIRIAYHAIGAGGAAALGAMYVLTQNTRLRPETILERALAASEEHCVYVREPFTIVSTENGK